MRTILLSLLMLNTFITYAQKAKKIKGGGQAKFETTFHLFNKIDEDGGKVSHKFWFKNIAKQGSVRITNVLTTCGCTTSDWTKNEVEPGDSGFVEAIFDPLNRPGVFERTLTITTNGKPDIEVLTLEGEVISSRRELATLYPHAIGNVRFNTHQIEIPNMKEDKIDTIWLGVYNATNGNLLIRNIVTPMPIRTEISNVLLRPNSGDYIMFTYNGSVIKKLGTEIDSIYLSTNDTLNPIKLIKVKANIVQNFDKLTAEQKLNAPVLSVNQKDATIAPVYQGEDATQSFEIINKGKSDLIIRQFSSNCKCMKATSSKLILKKGAKATVNVTLNTKGMHKDVVQSITMYTNDPNQPKTEFKLRVKVLIPGVDPL